LRCFVSRIQLTETLCPQTGELELHSKFPKWDPEQHYTVQVLTFIKKIFYLKDFYTEFPYNKAANDL
jgi:hypothetical protein